VELVELAVSYEVVVGTMKERPASQGRSVDVVPASLRGALDSLPNWGQANSTGAGRVQWRLCA